MIVHMTVSIDVDHCNCLSCARDCLPMHVANFDLCATLCTPGPGMRIAGTMKLYYIADASILMHVVRGA